MKKINVLVSFDLPEFYCKKILNLSDRISVNKSSNESELLELLKDAEILFSGKFLKQMIFSAPNLKWIQSTGAGVDNLMFPEIADRDVIITNSGNIFSNAISEQVLMYILMFSRNMNLFFRNQENKQWNRLGGYLAGNLQEIEGKTVGIIGFGAIGKELAKKAKCLGMKVIATKRTPLQDKPAFLDEFIPKDNLVSLLGKSDFVVLALPLTAQTDRLIGEEEFNAMKKTAYFINVSRGKIVQENKLLTALEKGAIAGAALDTFEEEPLSHSSKLWSMDNVIITPHVAGMSNLFIERAVNAFCQNLRLYLAHKPLINIVNKENGY